MLCISITNLTLQWFNDRKTCDFTKSADSAYNTVYVGVPKVNIENAVKKASSKGTDSSSSEFVLYDAQGPSGYHMIIEAFTQNNRKTRPEIKNLLARYS